MAANFGFTNKVEDYTAVVQFRDDAVEDGWSIEPSYKSESVDRASRLTRDGFIILIIARINEAGSKWKYEAEVNIWGKDRLAIAASKKYDSGYITKGLETCLLCGATGEVFRAGFAGRYCGKCLPDQKRLQEYPGWTN